jgi:hypothetical protein
MVDFERTDSGLLVPEQPTPRPKEPNPIAQLFNSVGLSTVVNAMMVVIQLATVWILWKTYQDTVIPNRQKELLSEQVAELELERKTLALDISAAKRHADTYDKELQAKRAELRAIAAERDRVTAAANTAQQREKVARKAEYVARASADAAQSNLAQSQWSIYFQSASLIVSIPYSRTIHRAGALSRARYGADDSLAAFNKYLVGMEKAWPNLSEDADLVHAKLLEEKAEFYPQWMANEFAAYFQKEAKALTCRKPDFSAIGSRVETAYVAAASSATKRAQDTIAKEVREARAQNIDLRFASGTEGQRIKVEISNATYKLMDKEVNDIDELIKNCYADFREVGYAFFEQKGIRQPPIPKSVIDTLNAGLRGD